ncbi:MAG: hypothetical protein H6Q77_1587 [Gemmatimonadetes bacterium]|nr:hypothetical protein [Gemmatimonadota bacterium]
MSFPERGAEAVHLPQRRGRRLDVQLPGLREVGLAQVEIVGGKEVARLLADGAGEDRRIHQHEVALVEEVADRLHHLVPHPRDRHLAPAPEPQVPVLEQELGPVFLGRHREIDAPAQQLEARHRELDARRRARILPYHPGHRHRRLLRQGQEQRPGIVADFPLGEHALHVARTVAQHEEGDLPARSRGHDPPAERHRLAHVAREFVDVSACHGGRRLLAGHPSVNLRRAGGFAYSQSYRPSPSAD